jgi:hypothetical protein
MKRIGCALFVALAAAACSSSHPSATPKPAPTSTTTGSARPNDSSTPGGSPCLTGVSGGAAARPTEVTGVLEMVGGPAPGLARPVRGTVTITGSTGNRCEVKVAANGEFHVDIAAGTYQLTGRSPSFGSGNLPCSADHRVTADRDHTPAVANVICPVR